MLGDVLGEIVASSDSHVIGTITATKDVNESSHCGMMPETATLDPSS
jgi:hypothetical protein